MAAANFTYGARPERVLRLAAARRDGPALRNEILRGLVGSTAHGKRYRGVDQPVPGDPLNYTVSQMCRELQRNIDWCLRVDTSRP